MNDDVFSYASVTDIHCSHMQLIIGASVKHTSDILLTIVIGYTDNLKIVIDTRQMPIWKLINLPNMRFAWHWINKAMCLSSGRMHKNGHMTTKRSVAHTALGRSCSLCV